MQFNLIYLLNILGREVLNLREKRYTDFNLTAQYIAKDIAFHGKPTQGHQQVPLSANLMLQSFSASETFLAQCFDSLTAIPCMSHRAPPSQIKLPCKSLTFLLDFLEVF